MNSFSYLITAPIELFIAGLTFQEHLQVRLAALLLNTLTGMPYGLWRAFLFRRFSVDAKRFWQAYAADTGAFFSFQAPVYTTNMLVGGASPLQALIAVPLLGLVSGLSGRPYGVYLDKMKKWFGVTEGRGPDYVLGWNASSRKVKRALRNDIP